MANNNSLIQFKRGTLTALNNLNLPANRANIEDGCFYLTEDTGQDSARLFIGRTIDGTKQIVPVNQGIYQVANTTQLKDGTLAGQYKPGDFCYVTDGNILAIYTNGKWVQINSSAEDDEHVDRVTITVETQNGVATVSTDAHLKNSGSDLADDFSITGANGIIVSSSGEAITVSGDTYTISADTTTGTTTGDSVDLKLDSTNTNNDSVVTIKGKRTNAAGNVTVEMDNDDIVIDARDTVNESLTITSDANKVDPGWDISITDSQSRSKTATLNPVIKIGENARSVQFKGNEAVLSVYTINETKELLRALDGLKYCGTIGDGSATYPSLSGITEDLHNGDMFKATSTLTSGGQTIAKTGDILIARGTEDTDPDSSTYGTITGTVTWDVIPSGDDPVQHKFTVTQSGTGINLVDAANQTTGRFDLVAGSGIALGDSAITSGIVSGEGTTVTISHDDTGVVADTTATAATQTTVGTGPAFTFVKSITRDGFGHVQTIETQQYTPVDTNLQFAAQDPFTSTVTDVGNSGKEVNVETGIAFVNGAGSSVAEDTSFNITSENLDVFVGKDGNNNPDNKVHINLYWGTF